MIVLSKPAVEQRQSELLLDALQQMQQGNYQHYIGACEAWFRANYETSSFLTPSCTAALEMAALTLQLKPGDEVILPSYTFVGTVVPFIKQGVRVRFGDSEAGHPNMAVSEVERLLKPATKAIVVVHYGAIACDMEAITAIANEAGIPVIEDAAHCIGAKHKNRYLGTIGELGTLSFDSQKNISCLQGGCLFVNNETYINTAETVRFNGTNKAAFLRKEATRFEWTGNGGNYELSNVSAALLLAQLRNIENINWERMDRWNRYYNALLPLAQQGFLQLPKVPEYAQHNAHIFYVVLPSAAIQQRFISYLQEHKVQALSHYLALHKSPYMQANGKPEMLPHASAFEERLVRLPLHTQLELAEQEQVIKLLFTFFQKNI